MNRIFAALMAASACVPVIAQAQAQADAPLTLERALELAGAAAPSLEAASAGVRAATAATTVAGLRPNLEAQLMTENVAGSGVYSGFRSAETTAQLALPLELGGKRPARVAVARAQEGEARLAQSIAQADLRLAVTQAYIAAAAGERRLINAQRQSQIAAEGLRAAQVRVRAGRASPLEEQRAEVQRVNAEAAAERAQRLLDLARGNLARRIGRALPASLDIAWFDRIGSAGPAQPVEPRDTLALAAARAGLSTASAQVQLAQAQRVPDVTVAAGARQLSASDDVAALFSVSVPLPVFNRGGAALDQARAQRDRVEADQRTTALQVEQELASAEAEVANAETTARAANGPAVAAAEEAARIARIGYREGKFGQLDLLDAERTLAETRASAIDALAAFHDAQARRDRLAAPAPQTSDN